MIKLVYCITKKLDLTDEEFFHYWKNIHGPSAARIPHLRRLVQSHRLTIPGDNTVPITTAWRNSGFRTRRLYSRLVTHPNGKPQVMMKRTFLTTAKLLILFQRNTSSWRRRSKDRSESSRVHSSLPPMPPKHRLCPNVG